MMKPTACVLAPPENGVNDFFLCSWTTACRPLKKGTVPLGGIGLLRRIHSLERDSPLFQQAATLRFVTSE
jgi:hypothetical protein